VATAPRREAPADGAPGAEDDLLARAQAGDRAALEALLRSHYDLVYSVCRRVTGDDADAQDAAQEALIGIVRGLSRFDGRSRFSTWVYRAAVNASIDELRQRSRRARVGGLAGEETAWDAEQVAARLDVDAALKRLDPQVRAAVVLRDMCGLDYAEIASVLGIPVGTAKSRVSRGRAEAAAILRVAEEGAR
jgi:RNA polymerase sigma-70 factor (ECF subfamily)